MAEEVGEQLPATKNLHESLSRAEELAARRKHTVVGLDHLMLALGQDPDALGTMLACRVEVKALCADLLRKLGPEARSLSPNAVPPNLDGTIQNLLAHASNAARAAGSMEVDGGHILSAIINGEGGFAAHRILEKHGMVFDEVTVNTHGTNVKSSEDKSSSEQGKTPNKEEAAAKAENQHVPENANLNSEIDATINSDLKDAASALNDQLSTAHEKTLNDQAGTNPDPQKPASPNPGPPNPRPQGEGNRTPPQRGGEAAPKEQQNNERPASEQPAQKDYDQNNGNRREAHQAPADEAALGRGKHRPDFGRRNAPESQPQNPINPQSPDNRQGVQPIRSVSSAPISGPPAPPHDRGPVPTLDQRPDPHNRSQNGPQGHYPGQHPDIQPLAKQPQKPHLAGEPPRHAPIPDDTSRDPDTLRSMAPERAAPPPTGKRDGQDHHGQDRHHAPPPNALHPQPPHSNPERSHHEQPGAVPYGMAGNQHQAPKPQKVMRPEDMAIQRGAAATLESSIPKGVLPKQGGHHPATNTPPPHPDESGRGQADVPQGQPLARQRSQHPPAQPGEKNPPQFGQRLSHPQDTGGQRQGDAASMEQIATSIRHNQASLQHQTIEDQVIENVPKVMREDKLHYVEVRVARFTDAELDFDEEGYGLRSKSEKKPYTKAITVHLTGPDGQFLIDSATAATQWCELHRSMVDDADFAIWRWRVLPRKAGISKLRLDVTVRATGENGLSAEIPVQPSKSFEIKVTRNYGRIFKRFMAILLLFGLGYAIARYGPVAYETGMEEVTKILKDDGD